MTQATTLDTINALSYLSFNNTPKEIAKLAFPDNTHLQHKAESKRNILAFYAELDTANCKLFCQWLDRYTQERKDKDKARAAA